MHFIKMQNQAFRYNLFLFFKIKKVFSLQSLTHFNMKRNTVLIFVIVLMFSACNFNSKSNKKLSKEEKQALLDTINSKKKEEKLEEIHLIYFQIKIVL